MQSKTFTQVVRECNSTLAPGIWAVLTSSNIIILPLHKTLTIILPSTAPLAVETMSSTTVTNQNSAVIVQISRIPPERAVSVARFHARTKSATCCYPRQSHHPPPPTSPLQAGAARTRLSFGVTMASLFSSVTRTQVL